MPRMKRETWGAGDQSWLGSSHGIGNARTAHLDRSAFVSAGLAPDGYVPSGTACAEVESSGVFSLVPYVPAPTGEGAESGPENVLAGFVLFDQSTSVDEDINVPLLDHGRIFVDRLPNAEDFEKPSPENDATTCVYA